MSPERRAFGPAATALGTALKAPFWCALAAEIAWLALSASAEGALSSVLGAKGRALAHLCSSSEPSPSPRTCSRLPGEARQRLGRPRAPLDAPETPYALVLFGSLFFGTYALFGWYYSP